MPHYLPAGFCAILLLFQTGYVLTIGLDPNPVIDRRPNPLFATKVAFRCLNGNMSQKKLDLFQLSSRSVAQAGAGAPQVMRSQFLQPDPFCRILHDVPDGFLGHPLTQDLPHFRYSTEDLASVDPRCVQPHSQFFHYPPGDRDGANMSCLALQIDNGPVFLPLFQLFDSEGDSFVATQTAGEQQREKCAISLALELFAVRGSPQREACSTVSQLPKRTPRFLTPFMRRIPAARSELSRPEFAAS